MKSWGLGACERRDYWLSQGVWPFTANWFLGVGFLILTSSYYCLLSITLGDILNKIALLYSSSSWVTRQKHAVRSVSSFIQQNCQRSFKKKMAKEASCNDFYCISPCRRKSKSYLFKACWQNCKNIMACKAWFAPVPKLYIVRRRDKHSCKMSHVSRMFATCCQRS